MKMIMIYKNINTIRDKIRIMLYDNKTKRYKIKTKIKKWK